MSFAALAAGRPLHVLAVGAHADDIEIGAGGSLLQLATLSDALSTTFIVCSADAARAAEAQVSANRFLAGTRVDVEVHDLEDGHFPAHWDRVKSILESAASRLSPDIVFGPSTSDAHQDHRTLAEILPTVFRDHLLLGYEIPKWDGDLTPRTVYVPLSNEHMTRKVELLYEAFPSQRQRAWFDEEVFRGMARMRGLECRERYAEAFSVHRIKLSHPAGAR